MAKQKKKHVSPQTKLKQSRAAKKRHRAPAHSAHAGEFVGENRQHLSNLLHSSAKNLSYGPRAIQDPNNYQGTMPDPKGGSGSMPSARKGNESAEAMYNRHYQQALEGFSSYTKRNVPPPELENLAHQHATELTTQAGLAPPTRKTVKISQAKTDEGEFPGKVRPETRQERKERIAEEVASEGHKPVTKSAKTGSRASSRPIAERIADLPDEERQWLQEEFSRPYSMFEGAKGTKKTNSRARLKLQSYLDLREANPNSSSEDVVARLQEDNRGKWERATSGPKKTQPQKDFEQRAKTGKSTADYGIKDKYASGAPSHENFGIGVEVPGVDSLDKLAKRFPSMSDGDLIKYQESQRQTIYENALEKNEKWAHELRAERFLGGKDAIKGQPSEQGLNQVVVFTTNVGGPTLSVNSDSLLGQYVIKKRKEMVVRDRLATRSDVKGEFPRAVRDQHLIELSAGGLLGAQGRYGAYQNTGWRKGTKRSKGFGKQVPLGAQVLRDTNGSPVYDQNGNMRYDEGYTAPFTVSTNTVGLRIFMG